MKSNTYETAILLRKDSEFFEFLRSLGIERSNIKSRHIRGDVIVYQLDLTGKDLSIREKLNNHQVQFLR